MYGRSYFCGDVPESAIGEKVTLKRVGPKTT